MAIPKKVKTVAGTTPAVPSATSSDNPVTPLNLTTLYAAVLQLQNSVNELDTAHNTHNHGGAASNPPTVLIAGGAGVAAANLFTTN
jgi:hypothetical protein